MFNVGNLISGMNSGGIKVMRYSGGIMNWTKEEVKDIDRTILTLNRCSLQRSSVARLYMKRKEGGQDT